MCLLSFLRRRRAVVVRVAAVHFFIGETRMVIVWGSKLMGKVDVVPGLFHVATKFGHLWYLPLIPTGTFVVLSESGDAFQGVQISTSLKSIAFAWLRAFMLIQVVAALLWVVMMAAEGKRGEGVGPTVYAAVVCVLGWFVTWSKTCTQASAKRAAQLADQIGLSDAGVEHLLKVYGGGGQGFDVVQPPTPVTPAAPARRAPTTSRAQPTRR